MNSQETQKSQLVVQKYGGATLSSAEKIKAVAEHIYQLHRSGKKIITVVSAMGKTTNDLIQLANQISNNPNRRELDMLLSTGERTSMALLSMALNKLGCEAISFTGSQAGVLTTDSHLSAYITDINSPRVSEALEKNKVVVLAGFQGVSPKTKEITTLGRGGSDITAIAMAAAFNASRCEILKDVSGVYTADPNAVKSARQIQSLSYDQLLEMTYWGAKVLQYRSVELAKRYQVPLYIGPSNSSDKRNLNGTTVNLTQDKEDFSMYEKNEILSLNSHETVLEISVKANSKISKIDYTTSLKELEKFLFKNEIPFPQILTCHTNGQLKFYVTAPQEIIESIKNTLPTSVDFEVSPNELCTVTATCVGSTSSNMAIKITEQLSKNDIQIKHMVFSPMSITCFLQKSDLKTALTSLHELIES